MVFKKEMYRNQGYMKLHLKLAKDFRDTKISQHSEGVGKEKTMGMDLEGEN
jgi:hypothetical protein